MSLSYLDQQQSERKIPLSRKFERYMLTQLMTFSLQHRGNYKIRLYERPDMSGQMQEVSDDCPNVQDRLRMSDINSCNVVDGHWLLYDQPNYRGRTYYLRPGEYRRYSDWGGASPRIGSLRRITDFN